MHPEIRKFWEDSGYSISEFEGDYYVNNNKHGFFCAMERLTDNNNMIVYYFPVNSFPNVYSEKEMLRIIKLKAFL